MNASYDLVASEYYDPTLHPTCANFDYLSRRFIEPRVRSLFREGQKLVEVGAGRSIVAPLLVENGHVTLLLVDESDQMLAHSKQFLGDSVKMVVADARNTAIKANSIDLLVSSLGDPYNTASFWQEVDRILKSGAHCLFTCPAAEWALAFRSSDHCHEAEFLIGNKLVYLPSFVLSRADQVEVMRRHNLNVREIVEYQSSDIEGHVSPKLVGKFGPVLRGYLLQKSPYLRQREA